jgi:arylsulfatase A-like enzyme
MMMRWPDAGIGRSTDPREVANIDIAPTVLSATGYHGPLNAPIDGRSLLDASWKRNLMLNEYWHSKGDRTPTWAAIRNRDFIYTEYYDAQGKIMFREYYDLQTDRWQLDNLLQDGDPSNDPNVGMLHHKLALARKCRGTTGASACP